jgi:hypothetical protein
LALQPARFGDVASSSKRVPSYNHDMTPQLTPERRQALARQPGRPLQVEDPLTHAQYVLVQLDAYEQMQRAVDYDTNDPDPRAFYPLFAAAVKHDVDVPGMEAYDADENPQRQQATRGNSRKPAGKT